MKKITVKELKNNIYALSEQGESSAYLIVGEDRACLIDTMTGFCDLPEVIRGITDKEIVVVNTHGHPDHIYGNVYFEKAFMNEADLVLADQFINDREFVSECEKYGYTMPPFENISEGDVIELGGRTLEVFGLAGHTPGGILLLLKEDRILFTGDSINHHLWMQVPLALSVTDFHRNLSRLMFLEERADFILHGHGTDFDDISLMRSVLDAAEDIISGNTADDRPYHWFGGVDLMHGFEIKYRTAYEQPDHVICYRKDNI